MADKTAVPVIVNRAANGGTLAKLIFFSISLAVGPISTYFLTLWYFKKGDATVAAIAAIAVANLILVAYIISSVYEDQQTMRPPASSSSEPKKTQ